MEGYTTINDGFSVDLNGNCTTNNMTANNVTISGGDIELVDTGEDSYPTIRIIDEDSSQQGELNDGDNLSSKTLQLSFPDTGSFINTTLTNGAWYNAVTTNKGNYIQVLRDVNPFSYEFVRINYQGTTTNIYWMVEDEVITNLSSYELPSDFGTITDIDSSFSDYSQYITTNNVYNKETLLNSAGVFIEDKTNSINTYYKADGWNVETPDINTYMISNVFNMSTPAGITPIYFSGNDEFFDDDTAPFADFAGKLKIYQSGQITAPGNISCLSLTQTSQVEMKKNFEKLNSGLDIIKNVDIYKYHMKSQDDKDKKHIGFVIGDDYKYSKDITSNENDGVDIYSMVSVCMKAIQEQQIQIEELKNEIKKLKESD